MMWIPTAATNVYNDIRANIVVLSSIYRNNNGMFSIILTDALQGIKPPQLSHLIRKQRFSLSFRAK